MAIKKERSADKSDKKEKKTNWIVRSFKRICRLLFYAFLIIFGGIIFNLDRMDTMRYQLLKYSQLVPAPFSKFLPGANAAVGEAVEKGDLQGTIIRVYDGDTATLLDEKNNKKYSIRFFGIDAPEHAQRGGKEATEALRRKILGKNVIVKVDVVDMYKRPVGRVMLDSRYINLEMVAEGFAWHYSDYAGNEFDLAAAEREARHKRLGIWREDTPQPPWEYRKSRKK